MNGQRENVFVVIWELRAPKQIWDFVFFTSPKTWIEKNEKGREINELPCL